MQTRPVESTSLGKKARTPIIENVFEQTHRQVTPKFDRQNHSTRKLIKPGPEQNENQRLDLQNPQNGGFLHQQPQGIFYSKLVR